MRKVSIGVTVAQPWSTSRRAHKNEKLEDFQWQNAMMRLKRLSKLLWKLPLIETSSMTDCEARVKPGQFLCVMDSAQLSFKEICPSCECWSKCS